jgi:hypothetical protein
LNSSTRFVELLLCSMIRIRPNLAHLSTWLWLFFWIAASGAKESLRGNLEFFEKRIRPVLAEKCYQCHSQESEKLRGGLLLDTKAGLEKGGESGVVVVPGEPEKSRLIQAIRYSEKDLQMPPKRMLSPDQIADFERWVKMGAPDSRISITTRTISTNHWAFKPLRSQKTPKTRDSRWPLSPIDSFVLARLEMENLQPAHGAQKRVLIRRATFDLTGLPPSPKQVEQFVEDSTPLAFSKVIDRLLATPQFGETWGRHWLDVARYADSNGLEINTPFENAWRYRDYVVRSFNQDKPFDKFIREQIAGDLIGALNDDDRYEKITATGFMALGPKVLGEPDREKLIMDVVDEQIDVTTRAFLGLTVSCARCHDHKFDPISTRDYYALAGIFKSTTTLNEASQQRLTTPWLERPLAPPEIAAIVDDYNTALTDLQTKLAAARQRKAALPGGIDSSKQEGILVDNLAAEVIGAWKESNYATNFVDKNYLHDGNEGKGKKVVRFRPAIPKEGLYEVRVAYIPRENRATNVPITVTAADQQMTVYLNERDQPTVNKIFASIGSFRFSKGTNGTITISNQGTKGFVAVDAVHLVEVTGDPTMKIMTSNVMKESTNAMLNEEPQSDVEIEAKLEDLTAKAPSPVPLAMAVKDGPPQNCRINLRGDSKKLGEEVSRGFIKVLGGPAQTLTGDQSGRLQLADWIANEHNPLTARVIVNRIWSHLFGKGIVNTPDNFGALGEPPSHPELLDYLALRFIEQGWSTKKLIREIMLSAVYQASSEFDAVAHEKDPDNNLLWRMNRRRLPVESIRDSMLFHSGTLDLKTGGASLETNGPMRGASAAISDLNFADNKRRSIYLPILRNDLPDMFQAFDFGDPHTMSGRRFSTTGATQALFMMNSPFVIRVSAEWADQLLAHIEWPDSIRVDRAFEQAFCRAPSSSERRASLEYLQRHENLVRRTEEDQEKRRKLTWQSLCQVLFASAEYRFLD